MAATTTGCGCRAALLRDGGRIVTISPVATRMANPTQTYFAIGQVIDATGGLFLGPRA